VFYTSGVSPTEARAVGEALVALNYLRKDARVSAEVTRDGDRRVVAFVMKHTAFSDDKLQFWFHTRTQPLSRKVYDGAPVDVWLIDDRLQPQIKLSWETRPREIDLGDHHSIAYGRDAVETEARAVAKVLEQRGYFMPGQPGFAYVMHAHSRPVVGLFLTDAAFDDTARTLAKYSSFVEPLSVEAFAGHPVDVSLDDSKHGTRLELRWETRR